MDTMLFDSGWKVHSGAYMTFFGNALKSVPDNQWEDVELPHDAARGWERDAKNPTGMAEGYTKPSMLYYQKVFDAPLDWAGQEVMVEFEGVYMNAEVLLNGNLITAHPYGYTSFLVDLTPYLRIGKKNTLLVVVNNLAKPSSRWYAGAGIYRHVKLHVASKVHVAPWQFKVTTPTVSKGVAEVNFSALVSNKTDEVKTVKLCYTVTEKGSDNKVYQAESDLTVLQQNGQTEINHSFSLPDPKLWDIDEPNLYEVFYDVVADSGEELDTGCVTFGVRSISFDSKNGFQLNGRMVKMKGGCVHHDHGPLGAAAYDDAEERRVRILKDAGYNAIRCAHNPPSPTFLDVCDRLGMLVMDEAFDCWRLGKNPNDYHVYFADWWQRDLKSMIDRDFNHPSIIIWSVGNEVIERDGGSDGVRICKELTDYAHDLDPSRPVIIASNNIIVRDGEEAVEDANWAANMVKDVLTGDVDIFGEKSKPLFDILDLAGYNYLIQRYEHDKEKYPERVIIGTETFPHTMFDNWMGTVNNDNVVGDFVWTSFDYLGESGIGKVEYDESTGWSGEYPWFYANCGDFDICGVKRPQSYYRDIVWNQREKPFIGVYDPQYHGREIVIKEWAWEPVSASYTFPGQEGKETLVDVYSQYDEVELLVNGKTYGKKPAGTANKCIAQFTITYEPGEICAVAYSGGAEKSRKVLRTTGEPAKLLLKPECEFTKELFYVHVKVTDQNGDRVPYAENSIRFTCNGPTEILAVANGDPLTEESFTADHRKAFEGRAMVILKKTGVGSIQLTVESDGLEGSSITL